jgi:hypothetical protein
MSGWMNGSALSVLYTLYLVLGGRVERFEGIFDSPRPLRTPFSRDMPSNRYTLLDYA